MCAIVRVCARAKVSGCGIDLIMMLMYSTRRVKEIEMTIRDCEGDI